eukprot:365217-Chlamydomonas_euryale.AAC.1
MPRAGCPFADRFGRSSLHRRFGRSAHGVGLFRPLSACRPRALAAQRMTSTCFDCSLCGRCSLRASRMRLSAGFRLNVRFIHAPNCTARRTGEEGVGALLQET